LSKEKAKKANNGKKSVKQRKKGIVYIKHLPHGFQEEQLRSYFSQFGVVTRVRLARSVKTLGSKGYAFIEFRYPEVASIAAEAMNNYLMFKTIIKTRYIPPHEIKHDFFRSGVKKVKIDGVKVLTSKTVEGRKAAVEINNRLLTTSDSLKRTKKIALKKSKSIKKLQKMGINYDIEFSEQPMIDESSKSDDLIDTKDIDIDSEDEFDDYKFCSNSDSESETGLKNAIAFAKVAETKVNTKAKNEKTKTSKGRNKKIQDNETLDVSNNESAQAKKVKLTNKKIVKKTENVKKYIGDSLETAMKIAKTSVKIDKKKTKDKNQKEKITKNVVAEIKQKNSQAMKKKYNKK
jgi:nucleolar protein 15